MASESPPTQPIPLPRASPTRVKGVLSDYSYQSGYLQGARIAVLQDLGSSIPMIPFKDFLAHLAPPLPDGFNLAATMASLKLEHEGEAALVPLDESHYRWSKLPTEPKESILRAEEKVFSGMPEIFSQIIAAVIANSGGSLSEEDRTVDFLQNPKRAPTSAKRRNDSRPDGYFVLKDRETTMKGNIFWADIVLSCEYKLRDSDEHLDDDVTKIVWSLQHAMRDDERHRASFGLTIENVTTRVWFCCRAMVIVSEPFNFNECPENLVSLFAAFAFADQSSLGLDTTIQPVKGQRGQFDIAVHPDENWKNSRTFRTIRVLSSSGAEPLRGRGTRVFEAHELDRYGNPNGPLVALKDIWIDSDRTREGKILTLLHENADNEDKRLIKKHFLTTVCHGDVRIKDDTLDDTANALMRKLKIADNSTFVLQRNAIKTTNTPTTSVSEGIPETVRARTFSNIPTASVSEGIPETVRARTSYTSYPTKTHYRIVFEEVGNTINRELELPNVMTALTDVVVALRLLRKLGWVHRDVSVGNILFHDGKGKLADLEYAKQTTNLTNHIMRTGTMQFMSVEVAHKTFLFIPQTRVKVTPFFHTHLHDLESLWWVATWIVFYNCISKNATPSRDRPSIRSDLYDTVEQPSTSTSPGLTDQLEKANSIFLPPAPPDMLPSRHVFFTSRGGFELGIKSLPQPNRMIAVFLDDLRIRLLQHYTTVEEYYPVNPTLSGDDIYVLFTQVFTRLKTESHDLVLGFIPTILLEKEKNKTARSRSESTNDDTGIAKKNRTY